MFGVVIEEQTQNNAVGAPTIAEVMNEVYIDDEALFAVQVVSYEEGRELLEENEIRGLIKVHEDGSLSLIANNMGMQATILRQFLDNYKQTTTLIMSQIENNPEVLANGWIETVGEVTNYVERLYVSQRSHDIMIVTYYSAIAMTCLYGAMLAASRNEKYFWQII